MPSNLLFLIAAAGLFLMFTRFARSGRRLAVIGLVLLAFAGFSPLGNALILPLEQRFPAWDASRGAPDGIVVLGGAIGPAMSDARGEPSLNEAAERMTVVAELARRYPNARIVFSGGDGSLLGQSSVEAKARAAAVRELRHRAPAHRAGGRASRNTAENATLSKAMANPKPGERWLLVTSAHHMPRSVGSLAAEWRTAICAIVAIGINLSRLIGQLC